MRTSDATRPEVGRRYRFTVLPLRNYDEPVEVVATVTWVGQSDGRLAVAVKYDRPVWDATAAKPREGAVVDASRLGEEVTTPLAPGR